MGVAGACRPIDGPANVYFFVDYMLMFVKRRHGRGRPRFRTPLLGWLLLGKFVCAPNMCAFLDATFYKENFAPSWCRRVYRNNVGLQVSDGLDGVLDGILDKYVLK